MASTARRVLAIGLGSLRGGSGNSNPSSPSAPSSLADGIDGMAAALKEAPNGEAVANALVTQAGVVVTQQAEKAEMASDKADAALVQAAQKASSNVGKPAAKSAAQLLAEAEAAGIAEAMAEAAAQRQAAEKAAANAALRQAGANAERVKAEAKAKALAKIQAEAKAKEEAVVAAQRAEDAEKATERLSELKGNIETLVTYIKEADPNSSSNSNQNQMTKNISNTNLDATRKILKEQISKYEKEVAGLKTVESVEAKLANYNKALAKEQEALAKLQSDLNASKNNTPNAKSSRRDLVGKLLSSNIITIVFSTAINRATERKTELEAAARAAAAEKAKAESNAVSAARAKAIANTASAAGQGLGWGLGGIASGIGAFAKTVAANPTRSAEMALVGGALGLAVLGDYFGVAPGWTGIAAVAFAAAAANVMVSAAAGWESTIVGNMAATLSPLASSLFTGLLSKKPEEVKAAKMQLRSADAKVKKEVAAAEVKVLAKASEAAGEEGEDCGTCRAIKKSDGQVCTQKGKFIINGHCICSGHKRFPPEAFVGDKKKKGGTRRVSRSGKRQTRKYRF